MVTLSGSKKREFGSWSSMLAKAACVAGLLTLLAACGGGENPGYSYTVRGTVNGLVDGGLVLQNNSGDDLVISANGSFSFATAIATGGAYSVTIKTMPPAISQTCTVINATGIINSSPATSVIINCAAPPPRFVVDPTGRFAYAANYKSNNISVYAINQTTGALTAGAAVNAGTNPNSVTIIPETAALSGEFAYVANMGSNNIWVYKIESDGTLTAGTPVAAGTNPYAVTVDPSGKFAYTANTGSNNVSVYTIDQSTGALTAGTTVAAGTNPYAVTVDPSGEFAYVANMGSNNISVYTIDQTTGALTAGTPVAAGTNPGGVMVDPSGRFAYTANAGSNDVYVYTIDQTTGALTTGTNLLTGISPTSAIIDPSGKFAYVANMDSSTISVYTIDQTTGALTAGNAVGAGIKSFTITIIPKTAPLSGKYAYAANYISNNIYVYTIDQTTGALTAGTTVASGTNPYSFTIDPSGKFAYALNAGSSTISVYTIDQTTGALTAGAATPFSPIP